MSGAGWSNRREAANSREESWALFIFQQLGRRIEEEGGGK